MTRAWFRDRDWRTGGYHAAGALAIQGGAAWLLWANAVPGTWWIGAVLGGGFWTVREWWTCLPRVERKILGWWPRAWQDRTGWDVLTAVVPVLAVALVMEAL
jgi:hypothetical protein